MQRLASIVLAGALAGALAGCGADPRAEYEQGRQLLAGAHPDARRAADHLRRAADAGSAPAAFRLASLLRHGDVGVAKDPAQAFARMRQAAEAKLPQAEFLLGHMLLAGEGTQPDPAQARHWFEQAAEHDLPEAHLELAMAGRRGELGITAEETQHHMMEAQHALKHRPPEP